MKKLAIFLLSLYTCSTMAQNKSIAARELHIGDLAPPLKVRYIKGQSVQKYEKGMVYVLEFWATWCVPCIAAMPHVSELAKKYEGKATFLGVSVWERGKPGQSINDYLDNFVKSMGDKMAYNIAMDGPEGYMVGNYVEAVGRTTIPTTIIIDKDSKVAWVGQPTTMDEPLSKIVDGTFDLKSYSTEQNAQQDKVFEKKRQQEKQMAIYKPMQDAVAAKDYKLVLSEYNKIIAEQPALKSTLSTFYFMALVHIDQGEAFSQANAVKDSVRKAPAIAGVFASEEGLPKKFYQYAIEVFEKTPANFSTWQPLATAYYANGNKEKAVEFQQKWVDWLAAAKSPAPAAYVEKQMGLLAKYKKGN